MGDNSSALSAQASGTNSYAVYATGTVANETVIYGLTTGNGGKGVYGSITSGTTGYGVYGDAVGTSQIGVYGQASGASGYGVRCVSSTNANGCGGNRAWYNSSDQRLKTHIHALRESDGLDAIRQLRPVRYLWDQKGMAAKEELGFIAQEVEAVLPELVGKGPDQEITRRNGKKETVKSALSMSYGTVTAPLVKAVQQLDALFQKLSHWLDEIGNRLTALTQRVDTQEREMRTVRQEIEALKKENSRLRAHIIHCEDHPSTAGLLH